ncbi:MAG: SDR family NAD(P)-dependent oxidoreductase, partial [Burkholderiales bacterium]|nr:SDR family NAD(P)-dependent oxidoreductase [Burkholderiales bacterium]
MADLAIVTGSSRGMGAAVALLLLERGYHVVGIARGTNVDLDAAAAAHGGRCEQWRADLADPLPVADRLERWLAARDADRVDSVTLVNNAATLAPIAPLDAVDPIDLVRTLRIGLEAPLVLTAAFLRATARWPARIAGRCRVLNVSSGLG